MHCAVIALGSAGDVHPLAAIAKAMQERGHRVTLLANAQFANVAQHLELEFVPIGSVDDYRHALADPLLWHPRKSFEALWSHLEKSVAEVYEWIALQDADDLVLVGSTLALGARIAHDRWQLPLVTVHLSPSVILSAKRPPLFPGTAWVKHLPLSWIQAFWRFVDQRMLDPHCAPPINAVRKKAGLKPVTRIFGQYIHSPQSNILLVPDWFAPKASDWPRSIKHVGFPLYDETGLHHLPSALNRFLAEGDKPLVFTPGSAMQHAHRFFRNAVAACNDLGRRGIVITRYTAQLPRLPASMLHVPYVPFSQLLPKSDLLAHHGGIGTLAQAMAAGIPQLVVPNAHDQLDNGAHLRKLGVGAVVSARASARSFTKTLAKLLTSSEVASACSIYQSALPSALSSLAAACAIIEKTALESRR